MKTIKVGSDFSGVGAFNQALIRLGISYKEVFACDMDKYARQTFIHNYGEPEYYPTNVYEREIPKESLDIYMTSPPCQAFSLAGKRLGKDDKRGILFFNSHEFIQVNKPRYFIFENVKGLLSDDNGKTFQEWVNMLGGKSVNGVPVIFPYEDSVPYHLYWKVLNAKEHGVPQNRERVFIIGIRDDLDNNFRFPIEEHLIIRLKDVLEDEVDDKYFLTDDRINLMKNWNSRENPLRDNLYQGNEITSCVLARGDGNYHSGMKLLKVGYINQDTQSKGVAQTLDTLCNQGVIRPVQIGQSEKTFAYQNGTIIGKENQEAFCIRSVQPNGISINDYKIRRLTPRECFRLMDFPDTFTWPVSDSQAYKQAGNSIVVNVLYKILKNLNL
jgi:DNA (cytosine-5)-methyltransferase 1